MATEPTPERPYLPVPPGFRATSEPPLSTFAAWQEVTPDDWQHAAGSLFDAVWRRLPRVNELQEQAHTAPDPLAADQATSDLLMYAIDLGPAIGYALARTQPMDLEGLDGWIKRACDHAGLDVYEVPIIKDKEPEPPAD
jgi:hypothetical protein